MSYFFRNAQIRKAFQNERTWDESKVTRGKTGPGTNDGSFAPSGGDKAVDPDKYAQSGRAHGMTPDTTTEDFKRHARNMADMLERSSAGDTKAGEDYAANIRQGIAMYGMPYADAVDAAAKRIATERLSAKQGADLARSRAYKPPEKIGIGAILRSSWGYGQTNVDYYQVTGMSPSGKTVTLREVAAIDVTQGQKGAGSMSGKKRALPDEFTGKPFQRRIGSNGRVKIKDYASASLWGGTDDYYSWDH